MTRYVTHIVDRQAFDEFMEWARKVIRNEIPHTQEERHRAKILTHAENYSAHEATLRKFFPRRGRD